MTKKYFSFFRLRLRMGLQYRTAAAAGVVTQFVWGFMMCFAYLAFYEANPGAFPMTLPATISYVWLHQAFYALFSTWTMENEVFENIQDGNIAYELCRPISLYDIWFSRNAANRISRASLRCLPILVVAFFLPKPLRMMLPPNPQTAVLFALTLVMGLAVVVSFCMLIYVLSFFMLSPQGIRIFMVSAVELLSGAIVPLPFMPESFRNFAELLPFAGMANVPLRVYSGDLAGTALVRAVTLQAVWLFILVITGKALCRMAERRAVVQGG